MVAVALDKKLRDNLRDPRSGMFSGDSMPVAQLRCVCTRVAVMHGDFTVNLGVNV